MSIGNLHSFNFSSRAKDFREKNNTIIQEKEPKRERKKRKNQSESVF